MDCERYIDLCLDCCDKVFDGFSKDSDSYLDFTFFIGSAVGIASCTLRHGYPIDEIRAILIHYFFLTVNKGFVRVVFLSQCRVPSGRHCCALDLPAGAVLACGVLAARRSFFGLPGS